MFNIHSLISTLSEKDRNAFDTTRATMQKAYLSAASVFGGIQAMDQSDSWFMDAIDQRLAYLMQRDGRDVPVILPTSEAIASTLPKASVLQLAKDDPTADRAGDVPQDDTSAGVAALAAATRARVGTTSVQPGSGGSSGGPLTSQLKDFKDTKPDNT